jgi:phage protein D/phage baseplate assembly protein gpV
VDFAAHNVAASVSVAGPLQPGVREKLTRVVVESQRGLPAMCEVEFSVDDPTIIENPLMRPGQSLKVEAGSSSDDPTQSAPGPVFDGEVVAVEISFTPQGGKRFLLRGYDKSHRMHRSRRTEVYLMRSDSQIASQLAAAHGLSPRVDSTPGTNDYLCQHNQTDWEFLSERAREIGYEFNVVRGTLVFRRAGADPAAGLTQDLDLDSNLLSFRLRATSAEQPRTTKVRSWNALLKTPVAAVATPPSGENIPQDPALGPATVAARFGTSEDVVTDHALELPQSALAHANAHRAHTASLSVEAEGSCTGNPAMVPGGKIKVGEIGRSFAGDYVLSTVRHVFDQDGFVTHFTVSGTHDRSLLGLAQPGAAARTNGHANGAGLASPVLAKVTNSNDDRATGRVKVEMPWLGENAESNWAPVVSVGAGSGKGWQVIPEVGDTVLVAFEHGDIRRPYVLGGIYNTKDLMPSGTSPPPVANGQTNVRMFKTRAGHTLRFDDSPGKETVVLETCKGSKLEIQEGPGNRIRLVDHGGRNEVSIDGAANKISVGSGGNQITIDGGANRIALKALGNVEIEATGQLKLKGTAGVEIQGTGPVRVASSATLALNGSAMAELKAALVKIN